MTDGLDRRERQLEQLAHVVAWLRALTKEGADAIAAYLETAPEPAELDALGADLEEIADRTRALEIVVRVQAALYGHDDVVAPLSIAREVAS